MIDGWTDKRNRSLLNFLVSCEGKLLMERHSTLFWSPCVAHCLDLMLEEIGKLEWVKSCVERAKNICKFIYNHAFILSTMRGYTRGMELARLGITRFALIFITLQSLLTSRAELRSMFVGQEWTTSSYATTIAGVDVANCIFDEDGFWKLAKEILEVTYELLMGRSPLWALHILEHG